MNSKLTFYTGVGTVTGANFLLDTGSVRIMVDCGMVQGERVAQEMNYEAFAYNPASVDILLITHAHLDHVGRIPKLVKDGFKGVIYSTPQTRELAQVVLEDAVNILRQEAEQHDLSPLYDEADVASIFPLWKTIPYHENYEIAQSVSVFLKDAGHILGSSMFEISYEGKKILFTGDVGNSPAPLLRDTESIGDVDYIITESVYGDRNHEPRELRREQLERVINETMKRGGTLVIPAFSIDRTQVLLYELNNLVDQKKIPSVPVFLDSPMGEKATRIYQDNTDLFNKEAIAQIQGGDDLFAFPHLTFVTTNRESQSIDSIAGAKIILAGSGMSIGGRVISHERRFLGDPNSTILLVGYQSAGSLGRELADGNKNVSIHGEKIKVRAHIETLYGYSAHKDSDHLVQFVATAGDTKGGKGKLKTVFVAMGEFKSSTFLAQRLNNELGIKAVVPERGEGYEI